MTVSSFIPNGRTSLVKRGQTSLQVQTEYAFRPYPRLTTTVLNNGQVVHKIEKKLERPISSQEEQCEVERQIKRQHHEIVTIIKRTAKTNPSMLKDIKQSSNDYAPLTEKMRSIAGVQRIYDLDSDGNFLQKENAAQFKNAFSALFKGLRELIEVFATVPGITITREKGVYEVERDHLYLVSSGDEIYIVVVKPTGEVADYESALKAVLAESFMESPKKS
ncbi:MAG: hypothetical protein AB1483_12785 [Candidatus Zixiibacteriota bacterium]